MPDLIEASKNTDNKNGMSNSLSLLHLYFPDAFMDPSLQTTETPGQDAETAESLTGKPILGFRKIDSAPAVNLYQSGNDYVVSADLAFGAELDLLTGDLVNTGRKSVYGGPDPDFKRMTLSQALGKERVVHPDVFCVANAQFFSNLRGSSAPVAFPLKIEGKVLSEGFAAVSKHFGKRLTLEINSDSANIVPFDNNKIEQFRNLKSNDAVVSLDPSVNIDGSAAVRVGRTFLGLGDPDKNGNYKHVFLFVSSASTQDHAENVLRDFGAQKIMMFDGGDSSQLISKKDHLIETGRTIPQFLAIIPALTKNGNQVDASTNLSRP